MGDSGTGFNPLGLVKDAIDKHNMNKLERDILREEWNRERDQIIACLKAMVKNGEYRDAKVILDKYAGVCGGDRVFVELKRIIETELKNKEESDVNALRIDNLIGRLNTTDKEDHKTLLAIYSELAKLSPDNFEYTDSVIYESQCLGLLPVASSDLRIGRVRGAKLFAQYKRKDGSDGYATLQVHTHGIKIIYNEKKIIRIHHSQLQTMSNDVKIEATDIAERVINAGIEYLVSGGSILSTAGAFLRNGGDMTSNHLTIVYLDVSSNMLKQLNFKEMSDKISSFIRLYEKEIEITKRTERLPLSEESHAKIIWISISVLIILLFIGVPMCATKDIETQQNVPEVVKEKDLPAVAQPAIKEAQMPDVDHDTWVFRDNSCIYVSNGFSVVVSNDSEGNQTLGMNFENPTCKGIVVKFDGKQAKLPKCKTTSNGIIFSPNAKLIKSMKDSNEMEITISDGGASLEKTVRLSGFTKTVSKMK